MGTTQATIGQGEGTGPLPGEDAGEWPAWALFLAIFVAAVALLCAGRWVWAAVRQIGRIVWRATPRRIVWAVRTVPRPGARLRWVAAAVVVMVVSFVLTRWAQARVNAQATTTTPTHVEVPPPMDTRSPAAFVHTVVPLLERHGLTRAQALLFAAHLARETGWGRWVRAHNYGNIKTGNWPGASFQITDRLGFRGAYRAYGSAEAGVRDAVSLIQNTRRYQRAWRLLKAGDARWYGQLGLDGYYEARPERGQHTTHTLATIDATQREYNGIVALVRRHASTGETQ